MIGSRQDATEFAGTGMAFPPEEYASRIRRARETMAAQNLDGLLAFEPVTQFYLTGFESTHLHSYRVFVLPLERDPLLLVWGDSELPSAHLTTWLPEDALIGYATGEDVIEATCRLLAECRLEGKRIGLEDESPLLGLRLHERLTGSFRADFVSEPHLVQGLMTRKSEREIECLRRAATMTAKGMTAAVDAVRTGASDNDVAAAAHAALIGAGSEYMCQQPIVNSGMRSGIPHTTHRRVPLRAGDTVLMEMSGCYYRYNAPMMRCAFIGRASARAREIFRGCAMALENLLGTLGPGVGFDCVAQAGKKGISTISEPVVFHKVYGYSVGAGFPPKWADVKNLLICEGDTRNLEPGMVFHHTMSVRDPGKYGIAVSETTLITKSGCDVLTNFERRLLERAG